MPHQQQKEQHHEHGEQDKEVQGRDELRAGRRCVCYSRWTPLCLLSPFLSNTLWWPLGSHLRLNTGKVGRGVRGTATAGAGLTGQRVVVSVGVDGTAASACGTRTGVNLLQQLVCKRSMGTESGDARAAPIRPPRLHHAGPTTREQRSLAALLADPSGGALRRSVGEGTGVLEVSAGHGVLWLRAPRDRGQPGWTVRCPYPGPHPTVEVEGTLRVPAGCRASPHWASHSGCQGTTAARTRPSRMARESRQ